MWLRPRSAAELEDPVSLAQQILVMIEVPLRHSRPFPGRTRRTCRVSHAFELGLSWERSAMEWRQISPADLRTRAALL